LAAIGTRQRSNRQAELAKEESFSMPRSAVHGRMASGDAREGQKSCADTSVIEETDIMRIQTLQVRLPDQDSRLDVSWHSHV